MNVRAATTWIIATASAAAVPVTALADCDARSGPSTAALIELYTSEGCSSCPPADRQLSRLHQLLDPAAIVVPIALHVDYFDYVGWKDRYAQSEFGKRQAWLVRANHERTPYTPEFFIGGSTLRGGEGALNETVRHVNAQPAQANIRLRASIAANDALVLDAEASARPGGEPAALYLALAESGLASKVTRGENGGSTLAHDHVVREWIGPVALGAGTAKLHRELTLPAGWNRARLELVGFVQDEQTGRVLQALGANQCAGS